MTLPPAAAAGAARIDLHAHSTASDGTDAPAQLMAAAAGAALDVVAITDHDTTDGWPAALAARPAGLRLVLGVELSCVTPDLDGHGRPISLHLLAYGPDPSAPELTGELTRLRSARRQRIERMVSALAADGHPVTFARVAELAGEATVGRPHVAAALLDAGLVTSLEEAFSPSWLGPGSRYAVGREQLDAARAVALVRAVGGVAVFAHPFASARGRVVGERTIAALAAVGLAGLEADHPDHDADQRARARGVAARLGLLATGSSDYHGPGRRAPLGAHLTAPAVFEALSGQMLGAPVVG